MKFIAIIIAAACLSSCGTGTTLTFGKDGIVVTPPPGQIIIPNTGK